MPSTMVHLLAAHLHEPGAPAAYWLGQIAPDCIADRPLRDKFHCRDVPNRERALREYEKTVGRGDWFAQGMLLHLFVDWKWDDSFLQRYIAHQGPEGWFRPYREEIGLLSARLYHDLPWSEGVWREMLGCDVPDLRQVEGLTKEDICSILYRANKYHVENPMAEPGFYAVAAVREFAAETVRAYQAWRNA